MNRSADSEVARLAEQLKSCFNGSPWHGSSLMELLRQTPVDLAPAKPLEHAHSIWEIVLHLTAWHQAIAQRLRGEKLELSHEQDWPPVTDFGEAAWQQSIKALEQSHRTLQEAIAKLSDAQLSTKVANRDHDYRFMLNGAITHSVYHAGQIALLRKSSR